MSRKVLKCCYRTSWELVCGRTVAFIREGDPRFGYCRKHVKLMIQVGGLEFLIHLEELG